MIDDLPHTPLRNATSFCDFRYRFTAAVGLSDSMVSVFIVVATMWDPKLTGMMLLYLLQEVGRKHVLCVGVVVRHLSVLRSVAGRLKCEALSNDDQHLRVQRYGHSTDGLMETLQAKVALAVVGFQLAEGDLWWCFYVGHR